MQLKSNLLMWKQTYIDSSKEINDKDHKFKISDIVRISNIKIFLQKVKLQIVLKRLLWLKKVKNNVLWTYIMNDIIRQEIVRTINQREFRIEKVIKRKGDKLYIKWKG